MKRDKTSFVWPMRRRRDQKGAALVESAIVLLPLFMVVFGIIEFGLVFKDSLTLSSASRAGARMASAMPGEATFYNDTKNATAVAANAAKFNNGDQMFIYKANDANGLPASGNKSSCTTNCVRYVWNNGTWVASGGSGWPVANQKACLGGTIDTVGVSVQLTRNSVTGFFPFMKNMKLYEHTAMKLEPIEDGC